MSTKGEGVYISPVIHGERYTFAVHSGPVPTGASKGTKVGRANFRCILSDAPIGSAYIKAEAKAGRMGARLMAAVADGDSGRVYLSPTVEMEATAVQATPEWKPEGGVVEDARAFTPILYGITNWSDLFTDRQLVGLTVFSDLARQAFEHCRHDALLAGMPDDAVGIDNGGCGATAYAEALSAYLALAVDRMVFYGSSLCRWLAKDNAMGQSMAQNAIMMTWDFAEGNPLGKSSADILTCIKSVSSYLDLAGPNANVAVSQRDAGSPANTGGKVIISTDPPYYDNVPYADLSDFFYIWLRRALKPVFPDLFATLAWISTGWN